MVCCAITEDEIKSIDSMMEVIPEEDFNPVKEYFEIHMSEILNEDLTINLIVDTNILISSAVGEIRKEKKSLFSLLMESPFIHFMAPEWIIKELREKIPEVSKEKKIREEGLYAKMNEFLKNIEIVHEDEISDYVEVVKELGIKDENDAPFIALYFKKEAHGILTRNVKHFEMDGVEIVKLGDVAKKATIFKVGAGLYYLRAETLPKLAYLFLGMLRKMASFVVDILTSAFLSLGKFIIEGGKSVWDVFSSIPAELKMLGILLFILFYDDIRDFLKELYQGAVLLLKRILERIKTLIEDIIDFILEVAPYLGKKILEIYRISQAAIDKAIEEANQLNERKEVLTP